MTIDHNAYEARIRAFEPPAASEFAAHETRLRRRKQGRATAADAAADAMRMRAATRPTLDGIVAEAEAELGRRLPKNYRRPAIDNRDDALYALRLACHVAGHTYFNDAHPWNKVEVIERIRVAETRRLRPFIRRIAHFAFGPTMRQLFMPPGTFRLETKLLDEETDTAPSTGLAPAVVAALAQPADDDVHPLGRLDGLRRLFDAQTPALQANAIDFVRAVYGTAPTWMVARPSKARGGKRAGAGRPLGARQVVRRAVAKRTPDERRRRGVAQFNKRTLNRLAQDGGVLERVEVDETLAAERKDEADEVWAKLIPAKDTDDDPLR